jgi:predicted metal-dependent phosphoesterase TrpH
MSAASPQLDLHTHSDCSDGTLTPAELITHAAGAGISVLALTDHDTILGLDEARRAAALARVGFVPGVELSCSWRAQSIHVLGLWIDPASAEFRANLDSQLERRQVRMQKICAQLERRQGRMQKICAQLTRAGLPGNTLMRDVEALRGVPTRTHLAQALVARGHARRTDDAFRKYLAKGRPAHVAAEWPSIAAVVGWIRGAGGIASLAHPLRYTLSSGARRQLLADFTAAGGGAIEVISGANGAQHAESCGSFAVKYGLSGSLGSDFHGPQQVWNPLGRLAKLPDCVKPVWGGRVA